MQVRYLSEQVRCRTRHELSLICRHASMSTDEGMRIHRIPNIPPLSRYTYFVDYLSVFALLKRVKPDVVYARVSSPLVGFAAHYCQIFGTPLVYHIAHIEDVLPGGSSPARSFVRAMERPVFEWGLRRADAVIAQADYQADLLEKHFGRTAAAVVPNFHPAPIPVAKAKWPKLVTWVANVKRSKGAEMFVELARRCESIPDVEFVMVGALQDDHCDQVVADARRLGNMRYLGARSVDQVNALLEQSHVFVNTSNAVSEGFPNTFIQAWLRRVPVVSLNVDPDSIISEMHFGLVAGGSMDRLQSAVMRLLENESERQSMGERARAFASERYSLGNSQKVIEVMESVAAAAGTPRAR